MFIHRQGDSSGGWGTALRVAGGQGHPGCCLHWEDEGPGLCGPPFLSVRQTTEKLEEEAMPVGRGSRPQQTRKYSELMSPLRDWPPPLPSPEKQDSRDSDSQGEKGHLVAISLHHRPRRLAQPVFLTL